MTELQTTRTLDMVAAEIRTFTASMLNNMIEIGRRLVEAKEMLPYGEFGTWVKENTAYSVSSANNFMRLYKEYGAAQGCLFGAETESQTFGKLSYSKALALLAVPAEEREEFAEAHDVEHMSTRELEQAIRERDAARAKAEAVEQLRAAAVKDVENLERYNAELDEKLADAQTELDEAKEKITELESRPVEVAVQEPDPAEVQKQIDAAVEEAKAAADKKQKELKDKLAETEKRKKELEAEIERRKKEASEAEKKAVEERAGLVSIEKARLEQEVEELKKKLAMSDAAVASFRVLFDQAQDVLNRLIGALGDVSDAETAGRLREAVTKLLAVYGEKVNA